MHRWLRAICRSAAIAAIVPIHALAGTTGGVTGRVVDRETQAPVAGVTVTATSPSQTATAVDATRADSSDFFRSLPTRTRVSLDKRATIRLRSRAFRSSPIRCRRSTSR